MRVTLPVHLIHSICILSLTLAERTSKSLHLTAETNEAPAVKPSTSHTSITLWDVGFSLRQDWADLREEEECPVPPDLIQVGPRALEGDQYVLEAEGSSLHPIVTTFHTPEPPVIHTQAVEEIAHPTGRGEGFVSFEEWKRIKSAEEGGDVAGSPGLTAPVDAGRQHQMDSRQDDRESLSERLDGQKEPPSPAIPNDTLPPGDNSNHTAAYPHAQNNRYNYASPDCSARIHSSSKHTQHASSLLHKSRDRYMLTPCKAEEHWVVVELCDDIRVESVEVSVWEFFSGVVRDVRVSIGGAEDEEEIDDGSVNGRGSLWQEVGAFVARNVRGVQVRVPPHTKAYRLDLHVVDADSVSPFSPPRLPLSLWYRVLLPGIPGQGVRDEPDGGVQVGAEADSRDLEGEGQGQGGVEGARGSREGREGGRETREAAGRGEAGDGTRRAGTLGSTTGQQRPAELTGLDDGGWDRRSGVERICIEGESGIPIMPTRIVRNGLDALAQQDYLASVDVRHNSRVPRDCSPQRLDTDQCNPARVVRLLSDRFSHSLQFDVLADARATI